MKSTLGKVAAALLLALAFSTPVRATDPPPLNAYGDLPAFEDAAISRSGNSLAIVALDSGQRKLMLFDGDLKPTRSLTVEDLKILSIQWIGDDAVLMVTSQTEDLGIHFTVDQAELSRGVVVPVEPEKEITVVFAKQGGILGALFGMYGLREVDGQWTGYFGGVRMARKESTQNYYLEHMRPSLIEWNFAKDATHTAAPEARAGSWRGWLVDGSGEVAATLDVRYETGDWVIAGPEGNRLAAGHHPRGAVGLVALGREGTSLIYAAEDDAGNSEWYEVPLSGGEPSIYLPDEQVVRAYRDPSSARIIGYLRRETTDRQVFFDPRQQELADKIGSAFKGKRARIVDWTPDFSTVLVRTSGNGDSGTWYLLRAATLQAAYIGSERPAIGEAQVGLISTFNYQAGDGVDLDGILTLPPGREAKNLPIVVMPHGGPGSYDVETFDWWAQAYASRGYAVFQPNFRGSTNRDEAFQRAGWGQWGRKMQSDITDGLKALADKGIVDAKRACIVGASYGGYAALAGVTVEQGVYRCAVAVAGVSDLNLLFKAENTGSGSNPMVKTSLLAELGPRSGFAEVSPARLASRADAPILLIHGQDDTVVPFEQSAKMADALKDAGKPYEMVVLREEDHNLSRAATRKQMLAATVAFVEKNNPAD
ncbi:prolyl oligopeptidase family serine peptidase [Altererythrobacter salegens]|uniref:Prolyl oligopeptidase family serine peptidase n=1 Tax=Croceibacterium salegens TaxID=1737568 RepID=A0A6I4STL6_9SPHN|nr:alpha/beta fold hydrolase [Croceibacterium salegens]MXO59203.1 prolyl oligopeptidase family serine peptidase [Croceibacterium salegens]